MQTVQISSCLLLLLTIGVAVPTVTALSSRVLDGEAAAVGSHPYSVSLQWNGDHVCGAALISDRVCLTAAHCVTRGGGIESYPARSFAVRAGSIQRSAGGQLVPVLRIVVHKGYADGLNDLALLVLQAPLTLNANTQPIELASNAPPTGAELTYSGWGSPNPKGPISHRLHVGSQKTISASDCQKQLYLEHEGLICLASATESSVSAKRMCLGDAGSPAVYKNELVAIGAFYVGGCGTSKPDGFMNVAYYRDWIKENSP
ncbi:serine protease SP24D [Drosophila innubila]|uniref:serine protease SP24D n=1 Tax=Drosophila innubila TaxID=198719 RepID=UPI00148E6FE9|nr:serine protease SP24D [Drosophila innubila]